MTDAFLWVSDVDRLHDELSARGAIVQLPPTDQTWGTRETGIRDPDGNGVELTWDRPQEQWPRTEDGQLAMFTRRLDLRGLLNEVAPQTLGSGPRDL